MPDSPQYSGSDSQPDLNVHRSFFDRHGFPPWLVGFIWLILAAGLFQLVGGLLMFVLVYMRVGSIAMGDMSALTQHMDLVLISNSTGQLLFLGLATLIIAYLAAPPGKLTGFLRLKTDSRTGTLSLLSVGIILAIQPTIWFLSWVNSLLPLPCALEAMEGPQIELIAQLLASDLSILFLVLNIALVPSICEEIMFRGFLMRMLERSWGIILAIIASGVLFGFFHLRLSQVIPLSTLGILLAWVTWRSGSLLPAFIIHLINNGGAVVAAKQYPELLEMSEQATMPSPLLLLGSLVVTGYLISLYYRVSKQK